MPIMSEHKQLCRKLAKEKFADFESRLLLLNCDRCLEPWAQEANLAESIAVSKLILFHQIMTGQCPYVVRIERTVVCRSKTPKANAIEARTPHACRYDRYHQADRGCDDQWRWSKAVSGSKEEDGGGCCEHWDRCCQPEENDITGNNQITI